MAQPYAVDIVFQTQGGDKLKSATLQVNKAEQAVQKLNGRLRDTKGRFVGAGAGAGRAANGVRAFGASSRAASGAVATLGTAIQAALGPLAAVGGAVAALTAAFQTLAAQDFAEAKVRTLGTNSDELVTSLKQVSKELKGQASVVELTGAAYDVASAGFSKAADASMVLKAASLGATGGFSDINTVANATTSVLNAYGLSAANAGALVDRFIQTQNDGKIVIGEYAENIAKVAPVSAALGIKLEEVNAIISQVTAGGTKAEVAFTGLKTALAQLASGQANKALADLGIQVSAADIQGEGLIGVLKRIKESGIDVGTAFKAFGTEAGPVLQAVFNDLEKTEQLLRNQENSAGASARAQAEAANTIQGAWKSVQTAFSNFFAEQSALGDLLKITLQGVAIAVEQTATWLNLLLTPITELFNALQEGAAQIDQGLGITEKLAQAQAGFDAFKSEAATIFSELGQELQAVWNTFIGELGVALGPLFQMWTDFCNNVGDIWNEVTGFLSQVWSTNVEIIGQDALGLGALIEGVWQSISGGVQQVYGAIVGVFKQAFDAALGLVQQFYNSLPDWLKGALSAAGGVVEGVVGAVQNAVGKVQGAVQKGMEAAGKASGSMGNGKLDYNPVTPTPTPTPTGGGKKGGGGGKSQRESQVPALQRELELKQALAGVDEKIRAAKLADDPLTVRKLELEKQLLNVQKDIADVAASKIPADEKVLKTQILQLKGTELQKKAAADLVKIEKDRQEALEGVLRPIEDEIELLQAKLAGNEEEIRQKQEILRLQKAIAGAGGDPSAAAGLVQTRDALKAQTEAQDKAKSSAEALAGSIGSALTDSLRGLIDGSMSAEEALSNAFKKIGDAFIDMAMQMIQEWIKMQIMGLVSSFFGGAGSGGGFGAGAFNLGGGQFGAFAEGGYVTGPTRALIGEGGTNEYVIPEDKMDSAMQRYSAGTRGAAVIEGPGASEAGGDYAMAEAPISITTGPVMQFNDKNYVTQEEFAVGVRSAAKQGEARTLARLRNSPSARRKIGL